MAKRKPRTDRFEVRALDDLREDPRNARLHPAENNPLIDASLRRFGQTWPVLIQPDGTIIAGHWRVKRMRALGFAECKCLIAEGWSKADIQAYIIADNQLGNLSTWDEDKLAAQIRDMLDNKNETVESLALGFTQEDIDNILDPKGRNTGVSGSLALRFGVPPFSVLNAREGWWQQRKDAWLALGIKSELGRADTPPGGAGKTAAYRKRGRGNKPDKPAAEPWGVKL